MADFSDVRESECLRRKKPSGCETNASHTLVLQSVINEIKSHGRSSMHNEVCGVLLGDLCFDGEPYLLIDARIEGKYATHQSGSVTFTSETWDYINNERDSKYPKKKIVGWYHTHPGFGIFLSNMDAFIHNNFFSLGWQPAYVFDPQAETDGFFFSNGGNLVQDDVVIVNDEPPIVVEPKTGSQADKIMVLTEEEEDRQSTRRFSTIILSAILFLVLIANVFCFFIVRDKLAQSNKRVEESARSVRTLEEEGKRLVGENGKLKEDGLRLNAKVTETLKQLTTATEQVRVQRDDAVSLNARIASLETLLADAKKTYESCVQKIREKERMLQAADALGAKKDGTIKTCSKQIATLTERAKALEDEISKLKEALAAVERRKELEPVVQGEQDSKSTAKKSWYQIFIFW